MRIFALETNPAIIKNSVMGTQEEEVLTVFHHWVPFVFVIVRQLAVGVLLFVFNLAILSTGVPTALLWPVVFLWLLWSFFALLRSYIDWRFNFLLITRDKIVIIKQFLFRRSLLPITLNNIESAEVQSQFGGLFSFGRLHIHLRNPGEIISLAYIAQPIRVARKLTNVVSRYNQRVTFATQSPAAQAQEAGVFAAG